MPPAKQELVFLDASRAVIDLRKLANYALDPMHAVGGPKARVIKAALGFEKIDVEALAIQIRDGLVTNPATPGKIDEYGARFSVDIFVIGPKGSATLRTGWIFDTGSDFPRLTTAFVKGEKREARNS